MPFYRLLLRDAWEVSPGWLHTAQLRARTQRVATPAAAASSTAIFSLDAGSTAFPSPPTPSALWTP